MSNDNINEQQPKQAGQVGGFVPASYQGGHRSSIGGARQGATHGDARQRPTRAGASQYSRYSNSYQNRRPQGGGPSNKAKIIIALIIVAALIALGVFIFKEVQKGQRNAEMHGNVTQGEMAAIDNELTGMTKFDEPFTVLLLGSDARSDDPDMGARTDTIVLVRVDPLQNIISMASIPRDTMINIPGYGTNKFNAAYTYGGPSGTIAAVKELTGVNIDHYAEVNFEGLVGVIDAMGGIDVYVDEEIDDIDAGDIYIPEGVQHLDGAAALVFSRSRAYADGDFTRVSNQRKVLEAIIRKGLQAPATELYGIIQESTEFLTTDTAMDVDFIYSLADQIRHNNDYPVTLYSATIPATTEIIEDVSYVIADEVGVQEMMRALMAGEDFTGEGGVVLGEEGVAGEAAAHAEEEASSSASADASSASSTGQIGDGFVDEDGDGIDDRLGNDFIDADGDGYDDRLGNNVANATPRVR